MSEPSLASSENTGVESTRPERIVGVGASAGGLESLEEFFDDVPPDSGMAFVVVQHLSPDFRSLMDELLGRRSEVPVLVATQGMRVQPDHIYVIPSASEVELRQGCLHLSDKDPDRSLTRPIDRFFRSLAADSGSRSVAVVLSGSGSDGSRGIRDVKQVGGLVLAQDADSAGFDGMPLSAQATGLVDAVDEPRRLAGRLLGRVADPVAPSHDRDSVSEEEPIGSVLRLLRQRYGLDFMRYKRRMVERRIGRRAGFGGFTDVKHYAEALPDDPEEQEALYHDLLIGVTRFFRDPDSFQVLEGQVIPRILEIVPPQEEIRAWVAGCATGEEAYSLAILLSEALGRAGRRQSFKILATDVHPDSLQRAGAGLYSGAELEHVSSERLDRFFVQVPAGHQVVPELRRRIVFAPHNVTEDAPFTRMHLVSCRNLLIYFQPETQRTVLSLFHFGLRTGGFLFLGASESPGTLANEFVTIDQRAKVFRKERDVRVIDPLRVPPARQLSGAAGRSVAPPSSGSTGTGTHLLPIYDQLLDDYMPPGLLLSEEWDLLDSFGGTEETLKVRPRRPSTNVLDLLDGDLKTAVAGALQRCRSSGEPVRYPPVPMPLEGVDRRVGLEVRPLSDPRTGRSFVLVTFLENREVKTATRSDDSGGAGQEGHTGLNRIGMLEAELASTRETLQSAVEEQQTSNEELQATNEELVASNEELQSTNEELHSVNEELHTVNSEYQNKIEELRELNTDMQHLLEGADNGTLFLDGSLRIRKFTPRLAGLFHLRAEDVGRSIRDFSHDLERPTLMEDFEQALEEGVTVEGEVRDVHDVTYFMRILPYRPSGKPAIGHWEPAGEELSERDGTIRGLMLTLTDISALDRARSRVRQLSAIVESSEEAILSEDLNGIIESWNRGAERLYGYSPSEAVGRSVHLLVPDRGRAESDQFLGKIRNGELVDHVETTRVRKDGTEVAVSVTISPVLNKDGVVVGASEIARDMTELRAVQREAQRRQKQIRLLLDSTAEAIFGVDLEGTCTFANPACARMLGYDDPKALVGRQVHDVIRPVRSDGSRYARRRSPIHSVLTFGEAVHSADEFFHRHGGEPFPVEYWCHPIRPDGSTEGAVVTFFDITKRRETEAEVRLAAERREEFLALLSHELRNPLAAVQNAIALLESSGDDPADPDVLALIRRQGRHMAHLLDDLLDVSRVTRGGIVLKKRDLDLRVPVLRAVEATAARFEGAGVELDSSSLSDAPVPVRGDPTRLQQIVVNLLTNAAKFSEPGTRTELQVERSGDQARVVVRDQGRGIRRDLLPDIFDLFVQHEQGLDRAGGGLGLGLPLVRQLTELHGGEVTASSAGEGRGSEFEVTLPIQVEAVLDGPTDDEQPVIAPQRRVVIVEDHADSREMLKILLETRGHTVFEAGTGGEGVDLINGVHPDVAFIDIGLPDLSGFQVAQRIREDPVLDDVVMVALTGYGTEDDRRSALNAGFSLLLTKPARLDQIDRVLLERPGRATAP